MYVDGNCETITHSSLAEAGVETNAEFGYVIHPIRLIASRI